MAQFGDTGAGGLLNPITLDGNQAVLGMVCSNTTPYVFADGIPGSTLTVNGSGIVSTTAGAVTINPQVVLGASQTWGFSDGGGSLSTGAVNLGTFALTIGATNAAPVAITGPITGTGTGTVLTTSGGNLTLSGASTFTGNVQINAGTLALAGGDNRLPTSAVVTFNNTAGTLAIGSTNQTLTNLALTTVVGVSTPAVGTVTGTGTLTVTGGTLQIGPAGSLTANPVHTLTMSGLSNFVYNNSAGQIRVGLATAAQNSAALGQVATWNLAASNTITAATLALADVGANSDGGVATVNLGQSNTLNLTTLNIATTRADGSMRFATGLTNPTVTIRGLAGGTSSLTTLNVGTGVNTFQNAAQTAFTSALDLSAGTADVNVATVNVAHIDTGTGTTRVGTSNASITLGNGVFNVTNLNLGRLAGTGTTGTQNLASNATFNQNGVTSEVNATNITIGQNVVTATGNTRSITAAYNLNNGTLRATTIQRGANTGNATVSARLNWANGTIENTPGANLAIPDIGIFLSAGTHTFNATGTNSITVGSAAVISGAGFGIDKTGPGTLVMAAPSTYTGTTTINAGLVQLSGTGQLGNSAPLAMTGGTFDLNGVSTTVGALSGTAGTIVNNAASTAATLTINAGAGSTAFAGSIADNGGVGGTVAVTKNGPGVVTLSGSNTYTGPTVVNNGTLVVTGAYPSASALTVSANGALSLVNGAAAPIATPTLSLGAGTGTATLSLELAAPGSNDAIAVAGTATVANTIRFDITALGGFAAGTYTLLSAAGGGLDGTAVYQVGAFPGGYSYTLTPSANNVLLDVFTITPTNGPIFYTGATSSSWAAVTSGNSQTFASDSAGVTPSVGTPNSTNTVIFSSTAASVVGPTVTTTLDGLYTVNDLVFNANTQSGAVTAVEIQPGNSPGNTLTIAPANAAAGIDLQAGAPALVSITAPVALGANQTWTVADAGSTLAVGGTVSGAGSLTKAGAGTVRFTDTNFAGYTGGVAIAAGVVQFNAVTAPINVPNVISGAGAITKTGANALTLSGANTFAGGLTLSEGTLNVNHATAVGTGTVTIAGGTLGNTSGSTVTLTNNNPQVWSGNFTTTGDTIDLGTGGVSFAADRTVTVSANSLIVGGAINGGTAGLTKAGTGVLALNSAASIYSGPTSITGGVLAVASLANSGSPSSIGTGSTVNITGATLRYTGSANAATDRNIVLTTAGTIDLANTAPDLTVELSGVISGTSTLAKVSSASPVNNTSNLILSGNNTFTGNVTVSNGNLTIRNSGALGTGTKTVALTAGTTGAPSLRLDPGVGNVISLPSSISFSTSFNGNNATNPNAFGSIDSRTGDNVIAGNFTLTSGGGNTALYVAAGSSLTLTGNVAPNTTARFLDLDADGVGLISGVIANGSATNTLGVTRSGGSGVWTLSGNNTYSVGTTISSGVLLVANSAGSGTGTGVVNVNGTAATNARSVLGGTGSVSGVVNVNVTSGVLGGMVRAGNSAGVGTLTLAGGLNVASGGRIGIQLLDASTIAATDSGGSTLGALPSPTSNNFLNITGGTTTLNAGAVIAVDATGLTFAPEQTYSYLVGQGAGVQNVSITDPGQFVLSGFSLAPSSVSFTANNAGNMYLNLSFPVPEPGTAGVVGAAGLLLLRRSRRRSR